MASQKPTETPAPPELDPEIASAGWDPYIVSITGGGVAKPKRKSDEPLRDEQEAETRELRLMAWLREHAAHS